MCVYAETSWRPLKNMTLIKKKKKIIQFTYSNRQGYWNYCFWARLLCQHPPLYLTILCLCTQAPLYCFYAFILVNVLQCINMCICHSSIFKFVANLCFNNLHNIKSLIVKQSTVVLVCVCIFFFSEMLTFKTLVREWERGLYSISQFSC